LDGNLDTILTRDEPTIGWGERIQLRTVSTVRKTKVASEEQWGEELREGQERVPGWYAERKPDGGENVQSSGRPFQKGGGGDARSQGRRPPW